EIDADSRGVRAGGQVLEAAVLRVVGISRAGGEFEVGEDMPTALEEDGIALGRGVGGRLRGRVAARGGVDPDVKQVRNVEPWADRVLVVDSAHEVHRPLQGGGRTKLLSEKVV